MSKVTPGGVAGDESAAKDFAGMIVEGEDESGIGGGWPPGMGRGIVLPELAQGGRFPASARFGAGLEGRGQAGKMGAHVSGDTGAGTLEAEAARQFVGQEREIQRLRMREDLFEELVGLSRPGWAMISAGTVGRKPRFLTQPLLAQLVEPAATDKQALHGRLGVELA